MLMIHRELHRIDRVGWLRASVLGANDGIVSTASLILGMVAAESSRGSVLMAGAAGLVAGAMAMAAGEYVSVHSQADAEAAELAKERRELEADAEAELAELTAIYVRRGLSASLAGQVARELSEHDALAAHKHDELGIVETMAARPLQAALFSACSFAVGAALPLAVAATVAAPRSLAVLVGASALLSLALLGAIAARAGGASGWRGAARVSFWGGLAMAATSGVGMLFPLAA